METIYKIKIISKQAPDFWNFTTFLDFNLFDLKVLKDKKFLKIKNKFKLIKINFEKVWKNDFKVINYKTLIEL